MSILVVLANDKKTTIQFAGSRNLLELLRENGYTISAPCGGDGRCGKCQVKLTEAGIAKTVLACQTMLESDCVVELLDEQPDISWNSTDTYIANYDKRNGYGAAVDLGTTTIAVKLYDLSNGAMLGELSQWNVQKSFGSDVITRIDYCIKNADGLSTLSNLVRNQVKEMLNELCNKNHSSYSNILEIVISGNTVMQHIFCGLSPASIASAPFTPQTLFDENMRYELDGTPVVFSPCIAGYVGGDITAGLLSQKLHEQVGQSLFIDVGTNGEMVLSRDGSFTACAVASGPAFEGAEISCGMPATDGAIYSVELIDDGLKYEVLGNGEAQGLCGSGLLDLVACLLELGYIDESGCLMENESGESVFYLTDRVFLTQRDIRQLQLAKAAVAAGICLLLKKQNIELDDLNALYLAGGFGNRLNVNSAIRIGMLPRQMRGKIVSAGNTSLLGAEQALLNLASRSTLKSIKDNCQYLELSSSNDFNDTFVEEMSFPEVI